VFSGCILTAAGSGLFIEKLSQSLDTRSSGSNGDVDLLSVAEQIFHVLVFVVHDERLAYTQPAASWID
jgi:hypothetical protein